MSRPFSIKTSASSQNIRFRSKELSRLFVKPADVNFNIQKILRIHNKERKNDGGYDEPPKSGSAENI